MQAAGEEAEGGGGPAPGQNLLSLIHTDLTLGLAELLFCVFLQLQQNQTQVLEEQRRQQLKLQEQQNRRQQLDRDLRLKLKRVAREQQEELQVDMSCLQELLKQETEHRQEAANRKVPAPGEPVHRVLLFILTRWLSVSRQSCGRSSAGTQTTCGRPCRRRRGRRRRWSSCCRTD